MHLCNYVYTVIYTYIHTYVYRCNIYLHFIVDFLAFDCKAAFASPLSVVVPPFVPSSNLYSNINSNVNRL